MNVNPVEATWLLISLIGWLIALDNVFDSWREWQLMLDGRRDTLGIARIIVARNNTRRELVRLIIQTIFLLLVAPALQQPGDTPLTVPLVLFLTFPALMALNSYLDRQERTALRLLAEQL